MNEQELIEYDRETQRLQDEINQHLSKFKDLDLLFKKAKLEIKKYFEEQNEYKDINAFIQYLKEEVIFYVNSFKLTREERKPINDKLDYIEETYSNLIYFGEFNPIKARIENLKAEEKASLHPDTQEATGWMKRMLDGILK